jgi:hypothetical protein
MMRFFIFFSKKRMGEVDGEGRMRRRNEHISRRQIHANSNGRLFLFFFKYSINSTVSTIEAHYSSSEHGENTLIESSSRPKGPSVTYGESCANSGPQG